MLLIDGYNLLYVTGLFGQGADAGTLRGSREALVAFLVRRLPTKLLRGAIVVFDAANAPPGMPDQYELEGLQIRFARGFADADALLEQLIEECPAPKGLLVVSSDHRVQRAARSRGAKYLDSETWYADLRRAVPTPSTTELIAEPIEPLEAWVERFTDPELLAEYQQAQERSVPPPPVVEEALDRKRQAQTPAWGAGLENIFPPGYAEDLLAEESTESRPSQSDF